MYTPTVTVHFCYRYLLKSKVVILLLLVIIYLNK